MIFGDFIVSKQVGFQAFFVRPKWDSSEAIAEHEHIPDVVAAEIGFELLTHRDGLAEIQQMIDEDIGRAMATGHLVHALELQQAKEEFQCCCCQAGEPSGQ